MPMLSLQSRHLPAIFADRTPAPVEVLPKRSGSPLPFDHTVCPGKPGARSRAAAYVWYQTVAFATLLVKAPLSRESYRRLLEPWGLVELVPHAIYRSAEPRAPHFDHLKKLGIRTLVCVKRTLPRERTLSHAASDGLQVARIDLGADGKIDAQSIARALALITQPEHWPVLLHCDGGRHRTGIVTAALRHAQGWTLEAALAEYETCAAPAPRDSDRDAIADYFAANVHGSRACAPLSGTSRP